jgi:hypothetical protein
VTPLSALWLPIVLSAVAVFIASSIIHMVLKWHDGDFAKVPDEERFRAAVGPLTIPPGDYIVPRACSMAEMKEPAFVQKWEEGPVAIMTVLPAGKQGMGKSLALWFVYSLVVSFIAAYVAGRALAPGVDYLEVFRFAGTTAFISYALGQWPASIWYGRKWRTTILSTLDGLIYGLLTAGVFGWLWPR